MQQFYGVVWISNPAAEQEQHISTDCLIRAAGADWWEWRLGSTLMFWRWPVYARKLALEGHPPWFLTEPPKYIVPQHAENDDQIREKVNKKLQIPLDTHYIIKGTVKSLTNYFAVPKGDHDIRMVYDASKSGLNTALWVPSFGLPTPEAR